MLPGPTNVPPRVMRAMMKPLIGHRGPEFKELYHRTLDQTKKVFETKGDLVILTSSGTGATECALQNVTDDGDEIIVTVNGFFSERLSEAIKSYGGKPVVVGADWGKAPHIDQLERAIKEHPRAKALAFVYNETSTGVTVRCLQQLGELCADNDILLMVDAISILGGDNLPVDDWSVDLCVTASQKCLMCPPGLSFVSVSEKAWEKIQTRKAKRSYYFDLLMYKKYLEEGFTPFTPAVSLIYALDEATGMILEEGLKQRYNRHRVCAEAIYNGTEAMGLGVQRQENANQRRRLPTSQLQPQSQGERRDSRHHPRHRCQRGTNPQRRQCLPAKIRRHRRRVSSKKLGRITSRHRTRNQKDHRTHS